MGNSQNLMLRKPKELRFFHETIENKAWLKTTLQQSLNENVLNFVTFNCVEFGETISSDGKNVTTPKVNENGIELLFLKLKEEIGNVLRTDWGSKGFIIKPTRGCMSEGNILVKTVHIGFSTMITDRGRSYEKFHKYFTTEDDLVKGIYEIMKNKESWKKYYWIPELLEKATYPDDPTKTRYEVGILIEELMDMPKNWLNPFELRITFLYGQPLVIWISLMHGGADLVIWRADNPNVILHWETLFLLNNKSMFSTEDFYDENLIFEILNASKALAQEYDFIYGRIDIFTTKKNDRFVWYVNEVQFHGIEPDLIYPEFIRRSAPKQNFFRAFFPIRKIANKHDIQTLFTVIDDLMSLPIFPESIPKSKLLSLREKDPKTFLRLIKEVIHCKIDSVGEQLEIIAELLDDIKNMEQQ